MDNYLYGILILSPIMIALGLALIGLSFISIIKFCSKTNDIFIKIKDCFNSPFSNFEIKPSCKKSIETRRAILNYYVRIMGTVFVLFLMFNFSLIKIFSDKNFTTIIFPDEILRGPSSQCEKEITPKDISYVFNFLIPSSFIKKRTMCFQERNEMERIYYSSEKSFWPNISYLHSLDLISNEFPVMVKPFRKIASTKQEIILKDIQNEPKESATESISFPNFLYKILFYNLIAISFFLAILKYWYENSYSRYRHFNDKFVDYSLEFNKIKKSNKTEKEAYAERIFQLLKEEYLIFYRCNFVYNSSKEIKWGYFLEYKFYQTNLLYALGTNEYLDEWHKSMRSFMESRGKADIRLGELDTYLYKIYLKRKKVEKSKDDNFLNFLEYSTRFAQDKSS